MVRKTKVEVEQEATGFGKKEVAPKYSKSEILKSEEFTKVEQDFLSAFLSEGTHTDCRC